MRCTSCREVVRPVAAIDIDGTLGDHHGHFQAFAERYVDRMLGPDVERATEIADGLGIPVRDIVRDRYTYDVEFSDWLGLDKELYRQIKLAYRQGGMKRLMPVWRWASMFVSRLQGMGVEVWLCTTRPWQRLDNIDPDTREWLRRHSIGFDGLIYGEDKYHRLADIVGHERVIGVLDDLPEMYDEAHGLGLCPIQKVNGHRGTALRKPNAASLASASRIFASRVLNWEHKMEMR